MEARFGPFVHSANIDTRQEHGLRRTYNRLGKSFWTHPIVLLGDKAQVEARFSPFGGSVDIDAI